MEGTQRFRRVPLSGLVGSRCPGLGLCPKTTHCPLPLPAPVSGCSFCFFLLPALSVYLCLSVSLCMSVSLCSLTFWLCLSVSPSAALPGFVPLYLFLCLSLFVSPSVYISLPSVSLFTNACLCLYLFLPLSHPPFYSYSPACCPWGAVAVQRDSLETPQGTARGLLPGHLHMPVTSVWTPSSLCSCGAGRGRPGGKTRCPASALEPRSP